MSQVENLGMLIADLYGQVQQVNARAVQAEVEVERLQAREAEWSDPVGDTTEVAASAQRKSRSKKK